MTATRKWARRHPHLLIHHPGIGCRLRWWRASSWEGDPGSTQTSEPTLCGIEVSSTTRPANFTRQAARGHGLICPGCLDVLVDDGVLTPGVDLPVPA